MSVSIAAAASGVLVGAALVATRALVADLSPVSVAFLRYSVAAILLLPTIALFRRAHFAARDLAPLALLGVAQFAVVVVLLNWSLLFITSAHAALLFATMPLITMALAVVAGRERLSVTRALGILTTMAGIVGVLGEPVTRAMGDEALPGYVAALASALVGAVCSLLYRPYLERYPTLSVSFIAMAASVVLLALPVSVERLSGGMPEVPSTAWLTVLFIGASSAVGQFLWLWALGRGDASNVVAFLALGPVTAALLGALSLGESITAGLIVGSGLVGVGLWLSYRTTKPEPDL